MNRKIILYIACSIDGRIADANGDVNWLEQIPGTQEESYGYDELIEEIDTTLMGNNTCRQILSWNIPFPYQGKRNIVFTKKSDNKPNSHLEFVNNEPVTYVNALRQKSGKSIWLTGVGKLNATLIDGGVVDEYRLFLMPALLGEGTSLLGQSVSLQYLELVNSKVHPSGVVALTYQNRK